MATNLNSASLAAPGEIVRKFLPPDQPAPVVKGAVRFLPVPECKAYIELADGTLIEDCGPSAEPTICDDEATTTVLLAKAVLDLARLDLNF